MNDPYTHSIKQPAPYGEAPFSASVKLTNWEERMKLSDVVRRVDLFTDFMKPTDVAVVRHGDPEGPFITPYDIRVILDRASNSTPRALAYFVAGLVVGAVLVAAYVIAHP